MNRPMQTCPECGATHSHNQTCNDDLNTLLVWETKDPAKWEAHHLMVLSYHLQHPTMYSQDGLNAASKLLAEFIETNTTPEQVRRRDRTRLNSNRRTYKITSSSTPYAHYKHPVHWPMTVADIIAGGPDNYMTNIKAWARSIYDQLKATENLTSAKQEPPTTPKTRPMTNQQKPLGKHWKPRHK